jgi:glutathione S-transferase
MSQPTPEVTIRRDQVPCRAGNGREKGRLNFLPSLAENEYFAGTQLSVADFAILAWAWRHPRHQVRLAEFEHVQRWYQALMARPAVARGFALPLRHPAPPAA